MCCNNRVKVEDMCEPIQNMIATTNGSPKMHYSGDAWKTCDNCGKVYNSKLYESCAYCTVVINPLGDLRNDERTTA